MHKILMCLFVYISTEGKTVYRNGKKDRTTRVKKDKFATKSIFSVNNADEQTGKTDLNLQTKNVSEKAVVLSDEMKEVEKADEKSSTGSDLVYVRLSNAIDETWLTYLQLGIRKKYESFGQLEFILGYQLDVNTKIMLRPSFGKTGFETENKTVLKTNQVFIGIGNKYIHNTYSVSTNGAIQSCSIKWNIKRVWNDFYQKQDGFLNRIGYRIGDVFGLNNVNVFIGSFWKAHPSSKKNNIAYLMNAFVRGVPFAERLNSKKNAEDFLFLGAYTDVSLGKLYWKLKNYTARITITARLLNHISYLKIINNLQDILRYDSPYYDNLYIGLKITFDVFKNDQSDWI